jgi:hypothetical protein
VQQRSRQQPNRQAAVRQDSNRKFFDDENDDDLWGPSRPPTSVRRYQSDVRTQASRAQADVQSLAQHGELPSHARRGSNIPPRRSATQAGTPAVRRQPSDPVDTEDIDPPQTSRLLGRGGGGFRFHWLFFVGLAMLVMLLGWVVLSMLLNWWQVWQDDLHYGRPRTFQIDAVVGHNDSDANPSHFVAINLNRHIQIIELPGGDSSKAKIYIGPVLIGDGQDLAVVTLSFKDVKGDGKPDMIVNVQNSRFVFINDNGSFRPARPGENVQ